MKTVVKFIVAIFMAVFLIGCGADTSNTGIENTNNVKEKKQFNGINRYEQDGKTILVLGVNNVKKSIDLSVLLALKEKMFFEVNYVETYVYDEQGNYIEWYSQLEVGKTYQLVENAYSNTYGFIFYANKEFTMHEGVNFIEISYELVDFQFNVKLEAENIMNIYDAMFQEYLVFSIDNGSINFTGFLNHKYRIINENGDEFVLELSLSDTYNYLENGVAFEIKETNNLQGYGVYYNTISLDEMMIGIEIKYNEIFAKGREFNFNVKPDRDVEIYINYNENNLTEIYITTNPGEEFADIHEYVSGEVIPAGSQVTVSYYNYQNLNTYMYMVEYNDDEELLKNLFEGLEPQEN